MGDSTRGRSHTFLRKTLHPSLRKALLLFVVVLVLGISGVVAVAYVDERIEAGSTNFVGTLHSNYSKPLAVVSRGVSLTSQPDVFAIEHSQGMSWQRTGWGYLGYLAFLGSAPSRHVQIRNSTGYLVENFTTSALSVSFATFPKCSVAALWDSRYDGSLREEGHLVEIVGLSEDHAEIRASPAYTSLFARLVIEADSIRETSRLSLACDELNITADARQIVITEPSQLQVEDYGSLRLELTVSVGERFFVWGPARLIFEQGNAHWDDVLLRIATRSGGITHRGYLEIPGFEALTFSLPGRVDLQSPPGLLYSANIEGVSAKLLLGAGDGLHIVEPVVTRTTVIPYEGMRQILIITVPLVFGIALSFAVDILRDSWRQLPVIPSQSPPPQRINRKLPVKPTLGAIRSRWRTVVRKLAVVLLVVLLGLVIVGLMLNAIIGSSVLYMLATRPVQLHVHLESTTNQDGLRAAYEVALPVLQSILGNPDVTVEFEVFGEDGLTNYDYGPAVYAPVGKRSWDAIGIFFSGVVDLFNVHHDGFSSEYEAFNDGPVSVFVDGHDAQPLHDARLIVHEFAHAWGLEHNPCSPVMHTPDGRLTSSEVPPSANLVPGFRVEGVDIFSEVMNQSFRAPPSWGSLLLRSLGNTVFATETRVMTRDVYLYRSVNDTGFYQVVRTHSDDLQGEDDWDSVELAFAKLESYLRGWTPGELEYIYRTVEGTAPDRPRPGTEC